MYVLKESVKEKAINMLFRDQHLSSSKKDQLFAYMERQFNQCHCVVLYYSDAQRNLPCEKRNKFPKLCDLLKINPHKRELIITESQTIMFSENYLYSPDPI